jgi:hypothetical protein
MAGQHAFFAPSSAHRVATCPASLLRTKDLPDKPSFEAVEGTVAHAIHEIVLLHDVDPTQYVGRPANYFLRPNDLSEAEWALLEGWTVPPEMPGYVLDSADWCREAPGKHLVEQRLSISRWTPLPDQFGTSDHIALDFSSGTLIVTDLKYGKGVQVFAERNYQAVMYALGAIDEFSMLGDFSKVVVRISQPRLDHRDVWETTVDELFEIGAWLKERFTLALAPDAPFHPEKHACQFCKLKPTCPALYERARELASGWFDNLDADVSNPMPSADWPLSAPDPITLVPEQIALVLENADLVTGFLEAVQKNAIHRLLHSQSVPGWKIVEGRSNRRWRDEIAAEAWLRERQVDPRKPPPMISPADAEKKLPKALRKEMAALAIKPEGKPTLAAESDPRPVFTPATADGMFADESDPNDL